MERRWRFANTEFKSHSAEINPQRPALTGEPMACHVLSRMHQEIVITLVGPDRPGLVDQISGMVVSHGGNWLESRMCHLGGQFAGVVRVSVPHDKVERLLEALRDSKEHGLEIVAKTSDQHDTKPPSLVTLQVLGNDRPGIVAQISRVLAAHHVNVEELQTACESAPMSGDLLFRATAKLSLPESIDSAALRSNIERIAADLMVDIELE